MINNLAKRFAAFAINFPLFRFLGPLGNGLRKLGYACRYLAWYHKSGIPKLLVKTPQPFGHANRFALYEKLLADLELESATLCYLEFGVAKGDSIKWWVAHNDNDQSRFRGFDVFTGLPERWGRVPKGEFSTEGQVPDVDDSRCQFIKGLFQDTLAAEAHNIAFDGLTVLHLDADLYSSTLYVLMTLHHSLKPGDILIFDEFAYVTDEFRAFLDYVSATSRKLDPVAAVNCGDVIAFRVAS